MMRKRRYGSDQREQRLCPREKKEKEKKEKKKKEKKEEEEGVSA